MELITLSKIITPPSSRVKARTVFEGLTCLVYAREIFGPMVTSRPGSQYYDANARCTHDTTPEHKDRYPYIASSASDMSDFTMDMG